VTQGHGEMGSGRDSFPRKRRRVVQFWSWPVARFSEPLERKAVKLGDTGKKRAVVMLEV
jgi:hypothetical protein